ncbi:MAG: gliding motility-associated C-terminal domain-containing protein, partial [Bacteroidota bacterium]
NSWLTISFSQAGTYIISLQVIGNDPNCFDTFLDTLQVFCEPRAEINGWQALILPGDTLDLTTSGPPGSSYFWLVNGQIAGSGPAFRFTSALGGSVIIQLIVDHGGCQDTTARVVKIGDCGLDYDAVKTYWALEDSMIMDFTVNPPVISKQGNLVGLQPPPGSPYLENSVTISDRNGNLLFYSNGRTIWDRTHNVMPNGSGIMGNPSTMQGTIAFPDPGDPQVYYLFTLDASENLFQDGLRYTKIDMRLRNGLGDVIPTQKNVFVMRTLLEGMHAVYHANGTDVWLSVSRRNGFLNTTAPEIISILITPQGVQPNPVVTPLVNNSQQLIWLIKFSHDSQWLLAGPLLCFFDRQTGVPTTFADLGGSFSFLMGADFSPDNSKLYVSASLQGGREELQQFDLSLGNPAAVVGSRTTLAAGSAPTFLPYNNGKIELGLDGKIYCASRRTPGIGVVQNPNLAGVASNFQLNGVPYPNNYRLKSLNLPTYIRGKVGREPLKLEAENLNPCPGEPVKVWAKELSGTYELTFELLGQGTHTPIGDTTWVVGEVGGQLGIAAERRNACDIQYDTLWLTVRPGPFFDLGPDQALCEQELTLEADFFPDVTYQWSTGNTGRQLVVNQPGMYWVEATDTLSLCQYADTLEVLPGASSITPDLGPDQSICNGGVFELTVQPPPGGTVRWWDGFTEPKVTIFESGTYWVTVTDGCGISQSDTITIELLPPFPREVPSIAAFCFGESVTVNMTSPNFDTYRWSDGIEEGIRLFDQIGRYYLHAQDIRGCWVTDTLDITEHPTFTPPELPTDTAICLGDTVWVDATTSDWVRYTWSDGTSVAVRILTVGGNYQLTATDINGCTFSDDFRLSVKEPRPLRLDAQYEICLTDTLLISAETGNLVEYQWSDGFTGYERPVWEAGIYTVQAQELGIGCVNSASTEVVIIDCPISLFLPNAFTPNNDGHNDWFVIPQRPDVVAYQLTIFNRWGNKLFDAQNPVPGWDGTYKGNSCPEGVYVYHLQYQGIDGAIRRKQGTITLIR